MNTDIENAYETFLEEILSELCSDDERGPFLAFMTNNYSKPDADDFREGFTSFQDAFEGKHNSLEDFCREMVEQCYDMSDLPDWITGYIDWEDVWQCELRHDYFAISVDDDGLAPYWVFRNV